MDKPNGAAYSRPGWDPDMRCECFRTDPAALIAALTEPAYITQWQTAAAEELRRLADRRLAEHLRALDQVASRIATFGVDVVAQQDPAAVDAWFTDAIAVGTWNGWTLPLEALGEQDLAIEPLPRGLIAADRSREGAALWLIDDTTIALARWREVRSDDGPARARD